MQKSEFKFKSKSKWLKSRYRSPYRNIPTTSLPCRVPNPTRPNPIHGHCYKRKSRMVQILIYTRQNDSDTAYKGTKVTAKQQKQQRLFHHDDRETSTKTEEKRGKIRKRRGEEKKKKLITFPADYMPNTTAAVETPLRRASAVSLLPRAHVHAPAPGVAAGSRADRTRT
jgi:hypothetical protein